MKIPFSNDIVQIAEQQIERSRQEGAWKQTFTEPVRHSYVEAESWCLYFARACWYWAYKAHRQDLDPLFAYITGSVDGFLQDANKAERAFREPMLVLQRRLPEKERKGADSSDQSGLVKPQCKTICGSRNRESRRNLQLVVVILGAIVIYVGEDHGLFGRLTRMGYHSGVCVEISADRKTIWAVEGNVNERGSETGGQVLRMRRSLDQTECWFVA